MRIKKWLEDIFSPEEFNDLNISAIGEAFNDASIRTAWLLSLLDDLRQMNRDVDRALLAGTDFKLADLCARRKAYQDVLESVLAAKRKVAQEVRPNPQTRVYVDLDRVTA